MECSVTVLVVEDEPLVRMMAAEIFADAGYCVCEAGDALGANVAAFLGGMERAPS